MAFFVTLFEPGVTGIPFPDAKLVFLPPYSPDWNPIEQAFHFIKAWLRRHHADASHMDTIPWLFYRATEEITPELVEEWARNSGYI